MSHPAAVHAASSVHGRHERPLVCAARRRPRPPPPVPPPPPPVPVPAETIHNERLGAAWDAWAIRDPVDRGQW